MKLVNGLLEYPKHIPYGHVYMFTGNRVIDKNGELVMGGGNALACKNAYPMVPKRIANVISVENGKGFVNAYTEYHDGIVGCMFTKNHWKDPSPLDMVIAALNDFAETASTVGMGFNFHLPYPAIGLGGLTREQLDPYVLSLPDNVTVYYKE